MKIGEVALKISFKETPTVIVQYDPAADLIEKDGTNGKYFVQPVKIDNTPALLPVSSARLTRKLQQFKEPCTLKITRTGEGMSIDYQVERIKKL